MTRRGRNMKRLIAAVLVVGVISLFRNGQFLSIAAVFPEEMARHAIPTLRRL